MQTEFSWTLGFSIFSLTSRNRLSFIGDGVILEGLEGGGPITQDPTRVGDTADLLGQIGHPDARPVLERLSRDPNEEVAEAAADALAELDSGGGMN